MSLSVSASRARPPPAGEARAPNARDSSVHLAVDVHLLQAVLALCAWATLLCVCGLDGARLAREQEVVDFCCDDARVWHGHEGVHAEAHKGSHPAEDIRLEAGPPHVALAVIVIHGHATRGSKGDKRCSERENADQVGEGADDFLEVGVRALADAREAADEGKDERDCRDEGAKLVLARLLRAHSECVAWEPVHRVAQLHARPRAAAHLGHVRPPVAHGLTPTPFCEVGPMRHGRALLHYQAREPYVRHGSLTLPLVPAHGPCAEHGKGWLGAERECAKGCDAE
mmetsp:Transcript_11651/g.31407  ORF Transcript_11651/g.31407 Transcript_11651/m.31407 type:complete len:284 (+) Transcript_11651:172-1023(+)